LRYFLFSPLCNQDDADLCFISTKVRGVTTARIGLGKPMGDDFPRNAQIHLSEDEPGLKLAPFLGNDRHFLIVSSKVRAVIEDICTNDIEFLPVTLHNHRGSVHSDDYCIVNPLGSIDVLDRERSILEMEGDEITDVDKMVLDPERLEGAPHLFRVNGDPHSILMSEVLVRAFNEQGFENLFLTEVEQVGGD
jgi:hypothetical protein